MDPFGDDDIAQLLRLKRYEQPTFLPGSRDIPLLPADLLRSDEFFPFKLEWESLDDQPLLEK
jgi:hypothetical protein